MKIISGIQPSGKSHIGNYLGAIKNWLTLQADSKNECFFFIADYHSITEAYDPKEKSKDILNLGIDLLALGLNPKKSVIFQQSQIPYHAEFTWILNSLVKMSELERMTQFKEKGGLLSDQFDIFKEYIDSFDKNEIKKMKAVIDSGENIFKNQELAKDYMTILYDGVINGIKLSQNFLNYFETRSTINLGLFDYPVLMAADILIYKAEAVPVGEDQVQHLELTRDLARRFNAKFGKIFPEPKSLLTKTPRIMSLTNPTKKMSKSYGPKSYIALFDSPEIIMEKIKSAVSDVGGGKGNGGNNLLSIFNAFAQTKEEKTKYLNYKKDHEAGKLRYADFKPQLAELIANYFSNYRKKRVELSKNPDYVKNILTEGAEKASAIAEKNLKEVKEKIGLLI